MDAAEDLFLKRCEKRVIGVRRPDDQRAAGPQNVERLLDHVKLQFALAAAPAGT